MSLSGERGRLLPRRCTHAAAEGGSGARRRSAGSVGRGLRADALGGGVGDPPAATPRPAARPSASAPPAATPAPGATAPALWALVEQHPGVLLGAMGLLAAAFVAVAAALWRMGRR